MTDPTLPATALAHCQRADKAEARVAELEGLLHDALPFLRSEAVLLMDGRWKAARDVANRMECALSKREGGR